MTALDRWVCRSDILSMDTEPREAVSNTSLTDRRRNRRLDVVVPLEGQIVPGQDRVTLLNISEGGFLMQSPSGFPDGAIWEFRFGIENGDELVLRGRIAHTMRSTTSDGVSYIVGVEFVDDGSAEHARNVQRLISTSQR